MFSFNLEHVCEPNTQVKISNVRFPPFSQNISAQRDPTGKGELDIVFERYGSMSTQLSSLSVASTV